MISFVVPAYNEERHIGAALASIAEAMRGLDRAHEVVVVDDGSVDGTAAVAEAAGAKVVRVRLRHIAAARNAGARAAQGKVLVFLDADTELPGQTLRAALRALEEGAIGGGAVVEMDRALGRFPRQLLRLWNAISRWRRWAAGCFLFVRRESFEAVGGFDEQYFVSEEIVLSQALKRRGKFVILSQAVRTSARKTEVISTAGLLWRSLRLLAQGKRGFRKREGLDLWYGPQREPAGSGKADQGARRAETEQLKDQRVVC